jgi:hypothetical protein
MAKNIEKENSPDMAIGVVTNLTFLEKLMRKVQFLKIKCIRITSENLRPNGQVLDSARGRQKSPYKLNIRLNTLQFLGNLDRSSLCRVYA